MKAKAVHVITSLTLACSILLSPLVSYASTTSNVQPAIIFNTASSGTIPGGETGEVDITDIFRISVSGKEKVQMTDFKNVTFNGKISPDGTKLLCQSDGVYVSALDGTNAQKIGDDWVREASWTPDGRIIATKMVYDPLMNNWPEYIVLMNADGSNAQLFATGNCLFPKVSPDGTTIGFTGTGDGIMLMNIDGSNLRLVPNTQSSQHAIIEFDWSPDGKKFTYVLEGEGVITQNMDGTDRKVVVPQSTNEYFHNAVWSPDGDDIAFSEHDQQGIWRIFKVGADGTNQSLVYSQSKSLELSDWSLIATN